MPISSGFGLKNYSTTSFFRDTKDLSQKYSFKSNKSSILNYQSELNIRRNEIKQSNINTQDKIQYRTNDLRKSTSLSNITGKIIEVSDRQKELKHSNTDTLALNNSLNENSIKAPIDGPVNESLLIKIDNNAAPQTIKPELKEHLLKTQKKVKSIIKQGEKTDTTAQLNNPANSMVQEKKENLTQTNQQNESNKLAGREPSLSQISLADSCLHLKDDELILDVRKKIGSNNIIDRKNRIPFNSELTIFIENDDEQEEILQIHETKQKQISKTHKLVNQQAQTELSLNRDETILPRSKASFSDRNSILSDLSDVSLNPNNIYQTYSNPDRKIGYQEHLAPNGGIDYYLIQSNGKNSSYNSGYHSHSQLKKIIPSSQSTSNLIKKTGKGNL